VNKRGKQRRLTNQLGRVFELVEKLKPEQRSLLVVVVNSVQDVGMSVRRERGLGTSHREGRFETASSISRRTSDQGRAARVCQVSGEAFADQHALCFRDRQPVLIQQRRVI
jgi:hypothetical protein